MADKIDQRMSMLAPEIAGYKERNLFTPKEIQKIITMRRVHECKIHRRKKNLHDFVAYIESEKKFEKLRNRRIKKAHASHLETDSILIKNIMSIYKWALYLFKEKGLVSEFADFCIEKKLLDDMKEVMGELCLKNPTDVDLWIFFAEKLWEINDIESARNTFIKCTGVNSDNNRVFVEFFRLECAYAEKINRINKEMGISVDEKDEIETGEIAMAIFKEIYTRFGTTDIDECMSIAKMVDDLSEKMKAYLNESLNE